MESVLDFDVFVAIAVQEDAGPDADGVPSEPEIGVFQVLALICAFCHVLEEGFDGLDAEEGRLLAAWVCTIFRAG
jgi:hypothetical protein